MIPKTWKLGRRFVLTLVAILTVAFQDTLKLGAEQVELITYLALGYVGGKSVDNAAGALFGKHAEAEANGKPPGAAPAPPPAA